MPDADDMKTDNLDDIEMVQMPDVVDDAVQNTEDGNLEDDIKTAQKLMPDVLKTLKESGGQICTDFMSLLHLISTQSFPLHNISFCLLLDVARWFRNTNTTKMRYTEQTLSFWKVGYKLFHGKFLRFMGGPKSEGQVIGKDSTIGNLDPQDSHINFAVPSPAILRESGHVNAEIAPGILYANLDLKAEITTSCILSVDGKKVASGLSDSHGDVNLFGHETVGENAQMNAVLLADDLSKVEELRNLMLSFQDGASPTSPITLCKEVIRRLSQRLRQLREHEKKQEMALHKFQKEAGDDWRKSRFIYAISSIQSTVHQIGPQRPRFWKSTDPSSK
jgi:hypothetical protein